jgi:hypothetical protein
MRNLKLCLYAALVLLALAVLVGGCATTTSSTPTAAAPDTMESMLTSAGFKTIALDTPQKQAFFQKLPDKKLVPHKRQKDGAQRYVYADQANKRLYVGDPAAYQNFINQAVMKQVEAAHREPAPLRTDDPEFWTMWEDSQTVPMR